MDKYKGHDIIKDYINFLKKMEELKQFLVEFNEDNSVRSKIYLSKCIIRSKDFWLFIIITYDKCTFSINNRISRA